MRNEPRGRPWDMKAASPARDALGPIPYPGLDHGWEEGWSIKQLKRLRRSPLIPTFSPARGEGVCGAVLTGVRTCCLLWQPLHVDPGARGRMPGHLRDRMVRRCPGPGPICRRRTGRNLPPDHPRRKDHPADAALRPCPPYVPYRTAVAVPPKGDAHPASPGEPTGTVRTTARCRRAA